MGLAPFQYHFEDGFAPNVIAEIEGSLEPDKVVVIGAHYDCRMSDIRNETARAPGANDDGSGAMTFTAVVFCCCAWGAVALQL